MGAKAMKKWFDRMNSFLGEKMRTTVDIPNELLELAIEFSGAKSKRAAICWALEEAVRKHAISDLLSQKVKIDFAIKPDDLEKMEIESDRGKGRRTH